MTQEQNNIQKEKLFKMNKFKLECSHKLEKNGDSLDVTFFINDELQEMLKDITISDTTDYEVYFGVRDNSQARKYSRLKRYLVKKVVYRELYTEYKDLVFSKKFIDTKKLTLKIGSIGLLNQIKLDFEKTINRISSLYLNLESHEVITFRVNKDE